MKTETILLSIAWAAFPWPILTSHAADMPANLVAARAKASQHGPFRTDPSQGIPKHAYSPFDKLDRPAPYEPRVGRDFLPGRLVIKLKPAVGTVIKSLNSTPDIASLQQRFAPLGVVSVEQVFRQTQPPRTKSVSASAASSPVPEQPDLTRWLRARCPTNLDVQKLAKQLTEDPDVEIAEPDFIYRLAGYIPNGDADPLFASQWHLAAAKVPEAWAHLDSQGLPPGGSRDIVVAVIDTGVDYNHPDLAANMWVNSQEVPNNDIDDDGNGFVDDVHGCAVVSNTDSHSGNPMDDHGHGTHVAGIIGAQAGNNNGVVGVAYNCQIMAIKAAQYSGVLNASDIAEAINYAVQQGADIVNMSFGGYGKSQVVEDALAVAFGQCVLVAAAGNDSAPNEPCDSPRKPKPMYPAAYNWVLGVMARTQNPDGKGNYLASFTNFDGVPNTTIEYELMAPGKDVWSALPSGQYAAWDGTSMAAPVVSGLAALARTRWADKDLYSSRFIMGQIATTGPSLQGRTNDKGLPVAFYHTADALAALTTVPKPQLSYLQHWLFDTTQQAANNDNDGIVDAGETVDLAIVIRNQWGRADQASVKLEAWAQGAVQADPYVQWLTDTVDYGAIGSFSWDDNGLIYDAQGVITGVRHPFRFTVSADCPNDHVIPLRLTMSCRNGFDPSDSQVYTTQSRFNLMVQRGRELPRVISQDMVLAKEYYWIVTRSTVIEPGVTVTVTEGTQVQFGAPLPTNPIEDPTYPTLTVSGTFITHGTHEQPVELFPMYFTGAQSGLQILGNAYLHYTRLADPFLQVAKLDHDYLTGIGGVWSINAQEITHSRIVNFSPALHIDFAAGACDTTLLSRVDLYQSISGASPWSFGSLRASVLIPPFYVPYRLSASYSSSAEAELSHMCELNAFLTDWHLPNAGLYGGWCRFLASAGPYCAVPRNYWGTTSRDLIEGAIFDKLDDYGLGRAVYEPILETPSTETFPFVHSVAVKGSSGLETTILGAETAVFEVRFNRDMSASVQPQVSFGPDVPMTDYTVHAVSGGWEDPRTWVGTFNLTPSTGDGYQLIRVAGAVAADDPWLITGDDAGRFRFEIITSGTESMNLQATGGEGCVDLNWMQDNFDLLAGYNLYRSTSAGGEFTRLNTTIIPSQIRTWVDTSVVPGTPYYYRFTVVKTDMTESNLSNVAQGTPLDTIAPVIVHTPLTSAAPGLPLTLFADVTDNVAVESMTLYFRKTGEGAYISRTMTRTTEDRYAATVEGSRLVSPGLEYYLEAWDGVSVTRSGRADWPWQVAVDDRPVVTTASPVRGPAGGGTAVTIAGSNFKVGARVRFGEMPAGNVVVLSSSQITCVTPAHYPAVVDVTVSDGGGASGVLLRGYTYYSDVVSLGLPHTGGGRNTLVEVPVTLANVQGLVYAAFTVRFDPAVLRAAAGRTGSLTPGWSVAVNTGISGQLRVAMASQGGAVSGSGVLAMLTYEVVGAPGSSTALGIDEVSLNDGVIPVETAAGSFAVNVVYDLRGQVAFWNQSRPVPGVDLSLRGDRVFGGSSGTDGAYVVGGADAGDYTLVPTKVDLAYGISAYDAALVLEHDAGLASLSGYAARAGDVNKSGDVNGMDAFHILQRVVGLIELPFPGAGVVWEFDPAIRSIPALSGDLTGQDFTAVLLGDVSGNWGPAGPVSGIGLHGPEPTAGVLSLRTQETDEGGRRHWLLARIPEPGLRSLEVTLGSDNATHLVSVVESGELVRGWLLAANATEPGQARLALAGAISVSGVGGLATLMVPVESGLWRIESAVADEGRVRIEVDASGSSFDVDTDGDGHSDWQEILAGTDPTSREAVLRLTGAEFVNATTLRLRWPSVAGRRYQVETRATSAGIGDWTAVGPVVTASESAAEAETVLSVASAEGYYRVRLVY